MAFRSLRLNKYRDRVKFWEELAGLYWLCGSRWCIGGDFNVVRFPSEKSSGGIITHSMQRFNDFIREANLCDPSLQRAEFKWSNLSSGHLFGLILLRNNRLIVFLSLFLTGKQL